jgi:hypothetical protein
VNTDPWQAGKTLQDFSVFCEPAAVLCVYQESSQHEAANRQGPPLTGRMVEETMSFAQLSYGQERKQRFAEQPAQALSGHPLRC